MAIAYDATSKGSSTGGNSVTVSHIIGSGSNRLLVVAVHVLDASDYTCSGVTYNGVAMTAINEQAHASQHIKTSLWYLLAPDTGTHNIVATITGFATSSVVVAASYDGVQQSAQPDASQKATGFNTAPTLSLTTVVANCMAVQCVGLRDASATSAPASSQTERNEQLNNGIDAAIEDIAYASTGAHTMSATASAYVAWNTVAASFAPASSGSKVPIIMNAHNQFEGGIAA